MTYKIYRYRQCIDVRIFDSKRYKIRTFGEKVEIRPQLPKEAVQMICILGYSALTQMTNLLQAIDS